MKLFYACLGLGSLVYYAPTAEVRSVMQKMVAAIVMTGPIKCGVKVSDYLSKLAA